MRIAVAIIIVFAIALFAVTFIAPAEAQQYCTSHQQCTPPKRCLGLDVYGYGSCAECLNDLACPPERPRCSLTTFLCEGTGAPAPPPNTTGSGANCTIDVDCRVGEFCSGGACVNRNFTNRTSIIWDTGPQCVANAAKQGNRWVVAAPCSQELAFPDGSIGECTSKVTVMRITADDQGFISVNGNFVYGEERACVTTPTDLQPQADATARINRQSTDNKITLSVEDLCPATRSDETTRSVSAILNITNLAPNPGQRCDAGTLVPKCAGTKQSCGFDTCAVCNDTWQSIGTPTVCSNPNLITQRVERLSAGVCGGGSGGGPIYGTCQSVPTNQTRTTMLTSQLCRYGCSAAACRQNQNPTISSARTNVTFVSRNMQITIASTASDPDTVYTASGSSRERVALHCSLQQGSVTAAPTSGGPGGPSGGGSCDAPAGSPRYLSDVNNAISQYMAANPSVAAASNQDTSAVDMFLRGVAAVLESQGFRSGRTINCNGNVGGDAIIVGRTGDNYGEYYDMIDSRGDNIPRPIGDTGRADFVELANWRRCPTCGLTTPAGAGAVTAGGLRITGLAAGDSHADGTGFAPDVCSGSFAASNPNCTFSANVLGSRSGSISVYCRAFDGQMYSVDVKNVTFNIDTTPPTSFITAPPAGSVQRQGFSVSVRDSDTGSGLDRCFYSTATRASASSANATPTLLPGVTRPPVGTCEWVYDNGVNANDPPAIEGTCRGVLWGGIRNINTALGCSQNFTYNGVPASEWGAWRRYAQAVVDVCNTFPDNYVISSTQLAALQNALAPLRSTCPAGSKGIACVCNPNPNDPVCGQFVPLIGGIPATSGVSDKTRQCNAAFAVGVGPGGDCPQQGTCTVSVWARDKSGNTATPNSRAFRVEYLTSNITSPPAGSVQRGNFSVAVRDDDFSGSGLAQCEYAVAAINGSSSPLLQWRNRTCNSAFSVSVGRDADCDIQGNSTCMVAARAKNDLNETGEAAIRVYSIDFLTPFSQVTAPPANSWQSSNFNVQISDSDPGGFGLARCEYRVVSKGVEVLPWRSRTCNAAVSIRLQTDCLDEGGDACVVFARATSASGAASAPVNRSFGIVFGNVTLDGFASASAVQTDTGLNFTGVPREALALPTFVACPAGASPSQCRAAFSATSSQCGLGLSCLCGSALENRCALRCSDRNVSYYLLASGLSGTSQRIAISNVQSAACPTFNIGALTGCLDHFRTVERELSVLVYETDFLIRNANSSTNLTVLQVRLSRLTEARDLAASHINRMETLLPQLSVSTSAQLLAECTSVNQRIIEILESAGFQPTALDFSIVANEPYRLNTSASVDVVVTKAGSVNIFTALGCRLIRPNGAATSHSFACMAANSTTLRINFTANATGLWRIECQMNRSVRADCSLARLQKSDNATFSVVPGIDSFIEGLVAPTAVINGTNATAQVRVRNPDIATRFAFADCSFVRPNNSTAIARSACTPIPREATTPLPVSLRTDAIGAWRITQCRLNVSSNSDCSASRLHNVSNFATAFDVTLPTNATILSILTPSAAVNGSNVSVGVDVFVPTTRFATVVCGITKPSGATVSRASACAQIANSSRINVDFAVDAIGIWNVTSCRLETGASSCTPSAVEDTKPGGSFAVVSPTNLTMAGINIPSSVIVNTTTGVSASAINPTNMSRNARLTCGLRLPGTGERTVRSNCTAAAAGATANLVAPIFADRVGIWSVDSCSLEEGGANCSSVSLRDSRDALGTFTVTAPTNLFIRRVVAADVLNASTASIRVDVNNPLDDDRFVQSSCAFTDPTGRTRTVRTECRGAPRQRDTALGTSFFIDVVGTWRVSWCDLYASTSFDCSSQTLAHNITNPASFEVVRDFNLSFSRFVTANASNNTDAVVDIAVRNPSTADRFALLSCEFRTPDNQLRSNASACTRVLPGSQDMDIGIFANKTGTWHAACTLRSSLSSDCSGSQLHDTESADFSVLPANATVNATGNATILSITTPSSAINGSSVSVGADVSLPATRFATVVCSITKPSGAAVSRASSCAQAPNGTSRINVGFAVDAVGTWNVTSCRLETSNASNCVPSAVEDAKPGGSFAVVPATNLSFVSISFPSSAAANATISISADMRNPTGSLRNGRFTCVLSFSGGNRTAQSSCAAIAAGNNASLTASLLADRTGTWSVDTCRLEEGQAGCQNASVVDTRNNLGTFNVNTSVSSTSLFIRRVVASDTLNASTASIRVDVANPTDDDRFVQSSCAFTDPRGATRTARTECRGASRGADTALGTSLSVDVVGTWRVSWCDLYASTQFDCSSASLAHNITNPASFEVVRDFNLSFSRFIIGNVFNGSSILADIDVRNPSTADRFAIVSCEFHMPDNQVRSNASACTRVPAGTRNMSIGLFADKPGTWRADCNLRSSLSSDCSGAQLHDAESREFNVSLPPDMRVENIRLRDDDLDKNEKVEILVDVRNPGTPRFAFVACNLLDPFNETVRANSSCAEVPELAMRTFFVDSAVDKAGTWNVTSCSVNVSTQRNCSDSKLHNTTNTTLRFNVTAKRLLIQSITPPPSDLRIGDIAIIEVAVKNIDSRRHSAFVNCTVLNPRGERVIFSTPNATIQPQQVVTFTPRRPVDIEGTWTVQACGAFRLLNSPSVLEDESVVNQDFLVSPLTECDASRPCPSGFFCQAGTCIAVAAQECSFNTDCPGTNERCFCAGGSCASCPGGFICKDHQCTAAECITDNECDGVCNNGVCTKPPISAPGVDSGFVNLLIAALIIIMIPIILFVFAKKVMRE